MWLRSSKSSATTSPCFLFMASDSWRSSAKSLTARSLSCCILVNLIFKESLSCMTLSFSDMAQSLLAFTTSTSCKAFVNSFESTSNCFFSASISLFSPLRTSWCFCRISKHSFRILSLWIIASLRSLLATFLSCFNISYSSWTFSSSLSTLSFSKKAWLRLSFRVKTSFDPCSRSCIKRDSSPCVSWRQFCSFE